eukprot:4397042-Amphidinium_carterae.3
MIHGSGDLWKWCLPQCCLSSKRHEEANFIPWSEEVWSVGTRVVPRWSIGKVVPDTKTSGSHSRGSTRSRCLHGSRDYLGNQQPGWAKKI